MSSLGQDELNYRHAGTLFPTGPTRLCFYQTRSAWSMDQGSNKNHSPAYNFAPTVTKFCVMWEGLSLPRDTKFGNCRCEIVDSRAFSSWSLICGLCWSGLIKAEPGLTNEIWHMFFEWLAPHPHSCLEGVESCKWWVIHNGTRLCCKWWTLDPRYIVHQYKMAMHTTQLHG